MRIWKVDLGRKGYKGVYSSVYVRAKSITEAEKKALKAEAYPGLDLECIGIVLTDMKVI